MALFKKMISTLVPVFLVMITLTAITLHIPSALIASILYFIIAYLFVLYFDIPLNPFMSQARWLTGTMDQQLFIGIIATQLIAVFLSVYVYHHVFT